MARPLDRGRPPLRGPRALLGYGGYAGLLGGAVLLGWIALQAGTSAPVVTPAVVISAALICWVLEQVAPYTPRWRPAPATIGLDILHSAASALAYAPVVRAGALALVVALGAVLYETGRVTPWPHHWPLGVQVVAGVALADLGAYLAHRFMHVSRLGWRVHVVHHSPRALHTFAAGRTHPFNVALTLGCETAPLLALGANPDVLALMTVVKGVNGLIQHSNIDLRPGWLSYVVATNEVHGWHHSVALEESNRNFGNTTMLWDQLFGTFFLPADRPPREEVGVADAIIPEHYLWHLAAPFLLQRFERAAPVPVRTTSAPSPGPPPGAG